MDNKENNDNKSRLQSVLAEAGIASRRQSAVLIKEGEVKVNGSVVKKPGQRVEETDSISFRGREVHKVKKKVYLALHKPMKYICSENDPEGRPLVKDLLENVVHYRTFYIGRLDYMSSGLILFTNDGQFAQQVSNPDFKIEKEYLVTTSGKIPIDLLETFKKGLYTNGEYFKLKRYTLAGTAKVRLVLEEGKNREIRKVFLSRNVKVKRIHRTRIGSVRIKTLPEGHFRNLTPKEISSLLKEGKRPPKEKTRTEDPRNRVARKEDFAYKGKKKTTHPPKKGERKISNKAGYRKKNPTKKRK